MIILSSFTVVPNLFDFRPSVEHNIFVFWKKFFLHTVKVNGVQWLKKVKQVNDSENEPSFGIDPTDRAERRCKRLV